MLSYPLLYRALLPIFNQVSWFNDYLCSTTKCTGIQNIKTICKPAVKLNTGTTSLLEKQVAIKNHQKHQTARHKMIGKATDFE